MNKMIKKCVLSLVASLVFGVILFEQACYAAQYTTGGTGGAPAVGGNGTNNPKTHYDCTSKAGMDMCPHWIKVPTNIFASMIEDGRMNGTYDNFSVCTDGTRNTDGYVVFAGKFYNGLYYLHNINSGNIPNPTKISRTHLEYYDTSRHAGSEWSNNLEEGNFFDDYTTDGLYTYEDLMNKVMGNLGATEKDLAFFCEGMVNDFFSRSNVSSDEGYATTGIGKSGSKEFAPEVKTVVGASVRIAFSHDLFSAEKTNDVKWRLDRNVTINGTHKDGFFDKTEYSVSYSDESNPWEGTANTDQEITGGGDAKYKAAGTRKDNNSDDDATYLARDEYEITFKEAGKYEFCEDFYVNEVKSTAACVIVEVSGPTNFLSISNVSNRDGTGGDSNYETTGEPTSQQKTVATALKLSGANKTGYITFSHNIYSNNQASDVSYYVERTLNGSKGFSSGNIDISYPATKEKSSNSAEEKYYGGDMTFYAKDKTGYYVGVPRNFSDGTYEYALRDYYLIKFEEIGTYEFCETVFVEDSDGDYIEMTSACSTITVGDPSSSDGNTSYCTADRLWTDTEEYGTYVKSKEASIEPDTSAETTAIAAVRNTESSNPEWSLNNSRLVYAKQGDILNWRHCYYPGVQRLADTISTRKNSDPEPSKLPSKVNSLNNTEIRNWALKDNNFKVTQRNMSSKNASGLFKYDVGDMTVGSWENDYKVLKGNVGEKLTETIVSSSPAYISVTDEGKHSWNCNKYKVRKKICDDDGKCHWRTRTRYETCRHSNRFYRTETENTDDETASVYVPYNFTTSTDIELRSSVVYAGEAATANATVAVNQRQNNTTRGYYGTNTPDDTEVRIVTFYLSSEDYNSFNRNGDSSTSKDPCGYYEGHGAESCETQFSREGALEGDYNSDKKNNFDNKTVSVYDVTAGSYFCAAVGVSHTDSKNDTNDDGAGNVSNKWNISNASCRPVAKRPSLQVWGNMFTSGNVKTSVSAKRVVAGEWNHPYSGNNANNTTVFGSWVELSIIHSTGTVKGLASGAATGRKTTNSNIFGTRSDIVAGGSHEGNGVNYCAIRIPLTIPSTCVGNAVKSSSNSNVIATPTDKTALVEHFINNENVGFTKKTETELSGYSLNPGETVVYDAKGKTFTVRGNITYARDDYNLLPEIPKMIIYAEDIDIECGVSQIDAVLIADGAVDTCSDANEHDENDRKRSNRLQINGAVIADEIHLKRTYGAATGDNSGVPAEIINYDTSLYLWGAPRSGAGATGSLTTVYQTELSPRY